MEVVRAALVGKMNLVGARKFLVLFCFLSAGFAAQAAAAQTLTLGDVKNDPPQQMAERIFGQVARVVNEVVPNSKYVGYLAGMTFYEKPQLFLNICAARAYHVDIEGPTGGDEDKSVLTYREEDVHDVYYMPDSPRSGCGHVGDHATFRADNVEEAGKAVSLLRAVIAAAASDAPLPFPVWNHCRFQYEQCGAEGLRAQLARLKITGLKTAAKKQWFDANGNVLTAYDLSIATGQQAEWHMQVDTTERLAPVPNYAFDVHGVHMDWNDLRPIP